jgi:predicted MPP superfamily phosphohydrolase
MFHTIITLAYLIPSLYLFFRLWSLFVERKYRWHYIVIFLIIFSIYPLGNRFDDAGSIGRFIGFISSYLVPFLLYFFLSVIVTDILLLGNSIFSIVPAETLKRRYVRNRYFAFLVFLSFSVLAGGIINFNTIRTSEYEIEVPQRKSAISKLRIAFISDFHLHEKVPQSFVRKFARKIKKINPDILLFGGDNLEGYGGRTGNFEGTIRNIHPKYGVFGVPGNHDRIANYEDNFFTRSEITLLRDSVVNANGQFFIAGRKDMHEVRKSAAELLKDIPGDLPLIMIDHRPIEITEISRTNTDISFSGHTHHGQLFPINLFMKGMYELNYGYRKINDTHFFVSSGIRLWGFPVRTIGKSEIMVVEVNFQAE